MPISNVQLETSRIAVLDISSRNVPAGAWAAMFEESVQIHSLAILPKGKN